MSNVNDVLAKTNEALTTANKTLDAIEELKASFEQIVLDLDAHKARIDTRIAELNKIVDPQVETAVEAETVGEDPVVPVKTSKKKKS